MAFIAVNQTGLSQNTDCIDNIYSKYAVAASTAVTRPVNLIALLSLFVAVTVALTDCIIFTTAFIAVTRMLTLIELISFLWKHGSDGFHRSDKNGNTDWTDMILVN